MNSEFVGTTIVLVDGEEVEINIYRNEKGNLELKGIGSVYYDMLDEELSFAR